MKSELRKFLLIAAAFLFFYFMPFDAEVVKDAIISGFQLLGEYAREHVLLCLVPAFFIAGAIAVLLRRDFILKYLGDSAKRYIAFPVASIAGGILAVCSCTILPLFAGIYKRGAGIGPATTFLFAGPAINIAAIFLTGRVIGWELAGVRIIGSITAAVITGMIMQRIFKERGEGGLDVADESSPSTPRALVFIALMMAFLILGGLDMNVIMKSTLLIALGAAIVLMALFAFRREHSRSWVAETWDFSKKILPYLLIGVFAAGIISSALPEDLVRTLLGGNRVTSVLFASIFGMFMYFATLTEIPVVSSLLNLGMGEGPALALLMAGNSLSLPSMIVISKLLGKKKAFTYFALVVITSATAGFIYGSFK